MRQISHLVMHNNQAMFSEVKSIAGKMLLAIVLFELSLIMVSAQSRAPGEELAAPSANLDPKRPTQEVQARALNSAVDDEVPQLSAVEKQVKGKNSKKASLKDGPKVTKATRATRARAQQVDRELIESLNASEFLEKTSELLVDYVQELGNLISALVGDDRTLGKSVSSALEGKVLAKLSTRVKKIVSKTKSLKRESNEIKRKSFVRKQAKEDQEVREARLKLMEMIQKAQVSHRISGSKDNGESVPNDDAIQDDFD